jgi:hypothetical protein
VICGGNAPSVGAGLFSGADLAIVYYRAGTLGWGPFFAGRPTYQINSPVVVNSPVWQTAETGSAVRMRAIVHGDPVLVYRWVFNTTTTLSCTNCLLELKDVQPGQSGAYTLVVTNAWGAFTNPPFLLSVIPRLDRRIVPGLLLQAEPGSVLDLQCTEALTPAADWAALDTAILVASPQWSFDCSTPVPASRFYRALQTSPPGQPPGLSLSLVPAITLSGTVGSSVRLDYIQQFGPTNAWQNLATVTLTNTSQLFFDTSAVGQPPRLWRTRSGP